MRVEHQLQAWRFGVPLHNIERDECCPDFSCCNGTIASREIREAFVAGNAEQRHFMLGMFLNCLVVEHAERGGKTAIVIGDTEGNA